MQVSPSIPDVGLGTVPRKEPASLQGTGPVPAMTDATRSPDARAALVAPVPVRHALDAERNRESTGVKRALVPDDFAAELLSQAGRAAQGQPTANASSLPQNLLPVISAWLKERVPKGGEVPRWPAPVEEGQAEPRHAADRRGAALDTMAGLYKGLASSHFFAAQRLAKEFGQITAVPARQSELKSDSNRSEFVTKLRTLAMGDGTADSIAQSLADVAIDSENAQQTARLLIEGQLLWQGELAPGVPLRLERRDAWRSHPSRVGEMQRGARLDVEVSLPNLGPLRIVGSQWGDEMTIEVQSRSDVSTWAGWSELNSALKSQFANIQMRGVDP
jgi:hypothetical protein